MKPSDEQLNRAAAEACGWYYREEKHSLAFPWLKEATGERRAGIPKFCTDRNALPELWDAVEKAEVRREFECILYSESAYKWLFKYAVSTAAGETAPCGENWFLVTLPARSHVIAALKALGRWPEAWEED